MIFYNLLVKSALFPGLGKYEFKLQVRGKALFIFFKARLLDDCKENNHIFDYGNNRDIWKPGDFKAEDGVNSRTPTGREEMVFYLGYQTKLADANGRMSRLPTCTGVRVRSGIGSCSYISGLVKAV